MVGNKFPVLVYLLHFGFKTSRVLARSKKNPRLPEIGKFIFA